MKKKFLFISLLFAHGPFFGGNPCFCEEFGVGTYTTYTYFTEGGCCSGIASIGGIEHNYNEDQGSTYVLDSKRDISGEEAQSYCCD